MIYQYPTLETDDKEVLEMIFKEGAAASSQCKSGEMDRLPEAQHIRPCCARIE
jgi:hypothetical protein